MAFMKHSIIHKLHMSFCPVYTAGIHREKPTRHFVLLGCDGPPHPPKVLVVKQYKSPHAAAVLCNHIFLRNNIYSKAMAGQGPSEGPHVDILFLQTHG